MQHFTFISVKLTLFLIVGILLGFYFEPKLSTVILGLLISLAFLGIAFKKQTRHGFPFFGVISALTVMILGVFVIAISNPKNSTQHYSHHTADNIEKWHITINEVLKPSAYNNRYLVNTNSLNDTLVLGKLLLQLSQDSLKPTLKIDDELVLFSKAKTISKPLNPHQFNYQNYLKKKGVYHQLHPIENQFILLPNSKKTLFGYASNFRACLIAKLKKENFGEEELAIIQALLLGQRNDISEETYTNYKNAGAVHILAVSGLHIGILLLLLQFVLKPIELLPKGRILKLITIVFLLWGFAFVAGLSASIVRAVTMFSFIAYAMYLNRPTNTFNIIALSMFFILLIKPLFLFQVGFQMSYAAVLAIVWVYPKLQRFWYPKGIILRKGWQLLSVSIAAQLGVLPISLFYFHQFPALFFVANLIVVPFLGIVLGLGILVLLLTYFNALPNFIVVVYNFLIEAMNFVIQFIAKQEAFVFSDIPFDRVQLVLGYAIAISLVTVFGRFKFKNIAFLLTMVVFFQGWSLFNVTNITSKEHLILMHETANSILLKQRGAYLEVFGKPSTFSKQMIRDYKTAEHIDSITYTSLKNSFTIADKKVYIMDSLGIYPQQKQPDYLVLTQSPKINLERVLDSVQPKNILADGSNYKSYISHWQTTCLKRKIPFHYTGEKGSYYFE